ncbi:MAG: outer membrane beta-barrel protein [Chitinophagaceae bacterium]
MKKVLIALCVSLVVSVTAKSQTEKGTWLLGGNVLYSSVNGNSSFALSPKMGIFVINNLALGAQLNLNIDDDFTSWAVGPFARYYFGKNEHGKPFLGASLNIGGSNDGLDDTDVGFGVEGGYALFLNKSIALDFGINYYRIEGIDMIGVGAGFQIHFKKGK